MGVLPELKEAKVRRHIRTMEAREAKGAKAKKVELASMDLVEGMDRRLAGFCVSNSGSSTSGGGSMNDSDSPA